MDELAGPVHAVNGLALDSGEEELQPLLHLAALPHGLQPLVVLPAMGLEVAGEMEQRGGEPTLLVQQQTDQQPTDPTIAVQEGMDGF